jgi:hypothetical protein
MKSKFWLIGVIMLVLASEGFLLARRVFPPPLSTAPMLVWPSLEGKDPRAKEMAAALRTYGADRGWKLELQPTEGVDLTAFYFEWDRTDMGPLLDISAHTPEVCNVASGLQFLGQHEPRTHRFPDGRELLFDTTSFATPQGSKVWIFKGVWIQGKGSLTLRRAHDRMQRLAGSFVRHAGAARVIQAGVFGLEREEDAWVSFTTEVLSQLAWVESAQGPAALEHP